MKTKIIIGAILIVLVLLVSSIFIFVGGSNPILPDNPFFPHNPDTYIVITSPLDSYTVPETGPWGKILVKGTLEKTEINGKTVSKIVVNWHNNIEYGRQEFTPTTNWQALMDINRLGSGYHSLQARAVSSTGELLTNYTIRICIPDKYIYEIDSTNLEFPNDFENYGYALSFSFPYPPPDDIAHFGSEYLKGKVIKIKGLVHVTLNPDITTTWPTPQRDLWVDVWNGQTQQWVVVSETAHISGDGWKDIDADCLNTWGTWICVAGATGSGGRADTVDGFKGEVWIQPGTYEYNVSPLEILSGFFIKGDIGSPPGP